MTLILTLLHPDLVGQASDLRLTRGSSHEDIARKLIFYTGYGAQLVVGYSGLAEVGGRTLSSRQSMEVWLSETLAATHEATFEATIRSVADQLESALTRTFSWSPKERLTIVMAGFGPDSNAPTIVSISNHERLGSAVFPDESPVIRPVRPKGEPIHRNSQVLADIRPYSGHGPRLVVHGDTLHLTRQLAISLTRRINEALGRNARDAAVRRILANTIEAVGERAPRGTVSVQAWATCQQRGSAVGVFDIYAGSDVLPVVTMLPRLVGPGLHAESHVVTHTESEAVRRHRAQIEAGDLSAQVTDDSLRAYLRSRPAALKQWEPILAEENARLGDHVGRLDRELRCLGLARCGAIRHVDQLLVPAVENVRFVTMLLRAPYRWVDDTVTLDPGGLVAECAMISRPDRFSQGTLDELGLPGELFRTALNDAGQGSSPE